jgi:energy-coupling factor transport system permease protein
MAFVYFKANSIFHRLHPLPKMWLALIVSITALATTDLPSLIILFCVVLLMWKLARIPGGRFKIYFRMLLAIFLIIVVVDGFLYTYDRRWGTQTVLFTLFKANWEGATYGSFYLEGALFGMGIVLRLFCIVLTAPLLVMTTRLSDFASVLGKMKVPYTFTFILLSGATFAGQVFNLFYEILDAQKLRGHDVESLSFFQKIRKAWVPIVTPLIMTMLRQADDLQMAIETRGFAGEKKTSVEQVQMRPLDYLATALITIVFIVCLFQLVQYGSLVPQVSSRFYSLLR